MKRSIITLFALLMVSGAASSAEYMSADQVKTLMSGKTFDGIYLAKDIKFQAYEDPDGTHNVKRPSGKMDKNRTWFVSDEGQHCTTKKKWNGPRCSYVKDAGNGEYHKISNNGEHTHTLTNFRDGNDL